ncbi:VWA domain-containing protein [Bacillus shivajii]|uniref:VWA domain-containing protein n=1 Tax=Bacillus shivajii TaxID=1983719 RepID=UPI001CF9827A|nr:VWA domain-containing protein [Bacillus shivajii]UCZ53528.1 VWA domain-containing protein [Bacillus shivajii]
MKKRLKKTLSVLLITLLLFTLISPMNMHSAFAEGRGNSDKQFELPILHTIPEHKQQLSEGSIIEIYLDESHRNYNRFYQQFNRGSFEVLINKDEMGATFDAKSNVIEILLDGEKVDSEELQVELHLKAANNSNRQNAPNNASYSFTVYYNQAPILELIDYEEYDPDFELEPEPRLSLYHPEPTINILRWNEINQADSYTVKRGTESGNYDILASNVTDTTYVDSDVEEFTTYYYVVEAVSGEEISPYSNEVVEYSPFILDFEWDQDVVDFSWSTVEGVDEYRLYRGEVLHDESEGTWEYADSVELITSVEEPFYEETLGWDENIYFYYVELITGAEEEEPISNVVIVDTAEVDSDGDGLPDKIELEIGSDPYNPDTNGNGIPDGYEYYVLNSDPSDMDSEVADLDFSGDGLTNLEEYQHGTDPWNSDTDNDGLTDYEEIHIYGTDPLNPDTSGNGLLDGSEVRLGFDPLLKDTNGNGVIDSEELLVQEVEIENLEEVHTDDNVALPSLTIKGKGDINRSISVSDDSENKLLEDLIYIVGKPIDIQLENEFEYADLEFKMDDSYELEELAIVHYDKGNIELLDTTLDQENHTISTTVDHFSIYYVAHIPTLLRSWGVDLDDDNSWDTPIVEKGVADIVFVIDTTGSMGGAISNVRNNVIEFAEKLNLENVDARLGLIDYKDITYDGPDSTQNLGWFLDPEDFQDKVAAMTATGGGPIPESAVDALEEGRRMGFRENASRHMILITDANYNEETRFPDVNSMEDVIENLVEDDITTSVITTSTWKDLYAPLYTSTGGVYNNLYSDFYTSLLEIVGLVSKDVSDGVWIRLSDGTTTQLKQEPDPNDLVTDSNGDGYADSKQLVFPPRGSGVITVPSSSGPEFIEVQVYDFYSHPNRVDTDGDGYWDKIDNHPLEEYQPTTFLLHGVQSNVGNVYGAYNDLAPWGMDSKEADNYTQTNGLTFANTSSQEVNAFDVGRLYERLYTKYHGAPNPRTMFDSSSEHVMVFNYANQAYITSRTCGDTDIRTARCWRESDDTFYARGSDADFRAYLNNLINEGKLERPTPHHKPVINVVAHSMGGLITRSMYELDTDPVVYIDNLVTWATPHFGTYLDVAGWGPVNAFKDLDRDSHLYEKLVVENQIRALNNNSEVIPGHTPDERDYVASRTEYHMMMGAALRRDRFIGSEKNAEGTPRFVISPTCNESTWGDMTCYRDAEPPSPSNSDERDMFLDWVSEHLNDDNFNIRETDGWVTLNGGLGYSGKMKMFEDDLGDQLLEGKRYVFAGPDSMVTHSPIHGNRGVIDLTVELLTR